MKNIKLILIAVALFVGVTGYAQNFAIGFKTGLNYSAIDGEQEKNIAGDALEEIALTRGFHLGAIMSYKLTDNFGLRGEVMYSQKGTDNKYEGQSYWVYYAPANNVSFPHLDGTRSQRLFVTNGYVDVPLTAFVKWNKFEFSGGVNVGFLVSSKAEGEIVYSGDGAEKFSIPLDFNYNKDEVNTNLGENPSVVTVYGESLEVPGSANAYYKAFGRTDKPFNTVDVGLVGGVSFFLSKSLFVGLRANYGLSDVTKTEQDISKYSLGANNEFIQLDHKDRNLSFQLSLGFSL